MSSWAEPHTRIVLVRHGEADSAVRQVVGGPTGCTGLSERGRQQAEALRDRLARTGELEAVVALYSSTLARARETAEIIAPVVGGLAVKEDCDLCELHVGEADGMSWADYETIHQFDMRAERDRPFSPGGESLNQFAARVDTSVRRLAAEHPGGTVVVACHGGIIAWSFHGLLGGPANDVFFAARNTSITEWIALPDGRWVLDRFNDIAHLPPDLVT